MNNTIIYNTCVAESFPSLVVFNIHFLLEKVHIVMFFTSLDITFELYIEA